MPTLKGVLAAAALAHEHGADLRILSDANDSYIRWILSALKIESAFSTIETNGSHVEAGRLRITPHQPTETPHGCPYCPPNLCKGAVIDRWREEHLGSAGPPRCIYVGDGNGDFCPCTRLQPTDIVFARQAPHHDLLRRCHQNPDAVRAEVVEWSDADDGASMLHGFKAFLLKKESAWQ